MAARSADGAATPQQTRHVWIAGSGFHDADRQGLVIAWARRRNGWSALCVWVEPSPDGSDQVVQRWLPADRLNPVRTDPGPRAPAAVPGRHLAATTSGRRPGGDYPTPFRTTADGSTTGL